MAQVVLQALWFLAPLWSVNVALNVLGFVSRRYPVIGTRDWPLDLNYTFVDGRRLLGDSTTVYGLIGCLLCSVLAWVLLQSVWLVLGPLLVYLGHALGSFSKRRLAYADGSFLPGVDHIDYVYVAGSVALWLGVVTLDVVGAALVLTLLGTPLITVLSYTLSLRSRPL